MRYTQLTKEDVGHMLETIGVGSIEELFSTIPANYRFKGALDVPPGLSEPELLADVGQLAAGNADCSKLLCFLGGGCYDHFIPGIVDYLAMRGEFLTAYTPYQAEASQGTLQAFYEFQSMICRLTGMEVANASMYEQSTAAAEAVLMAHEVNRRPRVVVSQSVHPDTLRVIETVKSGFWVDVAPMGNDGVTDLAALSRAVNQETATIVVQSPNFFGCIERVDLVSRIAKEAGATLIVSADPIASGVLKTPGELGADIVVGEGQCLGNPMSYGGPALGLFAARSKFLRKMPGRIIGVGADTQGRRGFCLVMQTREQHIRRERATSNICTNQGLLAMRAAVYLSAMGKHGIAAVASQCLDKAHYAAGHIAELDGYSLRFAAPFFKEFTVRTRRNVKSVLASCRERGVLAGVALGRWHENLADCFTVAVTEKRTRAEIDRLIEALKAA